MMKAWNKGIIAWFAHNSVAANLLMAILLLAGLFSALTVRKEIQPKIEIDTITITVPYLGAAPKEVEEGVLIKIEEAVQDVEGIEELRSVANEGSGTVTVDVASGYDVDVVLDQVKLRVDAIPTFPVETEKPIISRPSFQQQVLWVTLSGDISERVLTEYAKRVQSELEDLPEVWQARSAGLRDYEITIEVSEQVLREYDLSFQQVVTAVRNSSVDLPGGSIRAEGGDIRLRAKGQAYTGREFENLVLLTLADGSRLTVGDIAVVRDGFVEGDRYSSFDQLSAISLRVLSGEDQDELVVAKAVHSYIAGKQQQLPQGIKLTAWADTSHYLQGRLDLMTRNMIFGAMLVMLILTMFLRWKIAFWVIVGIPVCFLGAFWLMPLFGVSINMLSLFAFILVLGIVVDDAIIIGESIFTEIRAKGHTMENIVRGAHRVALPATFGVLTTIAAFTPLLFVGGVLAPFFESIAVVVILCLIFSLVESKLILPVHLAHMKLKRVSEEKRGRLVRFQRYFSDGLETFVERHYRPALETCLRNRHITVATAIAILILSIGLIAGGVVRTVFFPRLAADFLQATLEMSEGTPVTTTIDAIQKVEAAIFELDREVSEEFGESSGAIVKHVIAFKTGDLSGTLVVEMVKDEFSPLKGDEVLKRWREKVGEIPGTRQLGFSSALGGPSSGPPIALRFVGADVQVLDAAADRLVEKLRSYKGLYDIRNEFDAGPEEIQLRIKPEAEALGLTLADLGRQVRNGFYGAEAQRIQRGRDEVKVMVRYPEDQRRSVGNLENMRVRTPAGDQVPFSAVAEVLVSKGYSSIHRVDRLRSVTVSSDADLSQVEPSNVMQELTTEFIPEMLKDYPGVSFRLTGQSQDVEELINSLVKGFALALFLIYALMAIPLRSYVQPLMIMVAIPFGIIGAIVGHLLFGMALTMMSYFGMIALSGVVVNDSLIMVDFVNKAIAEGRSVKYAAVEAGTRRFRAIMLTSLTTFFGLLPMVLERSVQAQFLIPMALSLAFGIMFATAITLFLVPALYLLVDDARAFFRGESGLERMAAEEGLDLFDSGQALLDTD